MNNKRGFFRLEPIKPFCANMEIIRVKNNVIQSGHAQVCVDDFAAGGLRFVSDLRLIIEEAVVLQFELQLWNQPIKVQGTIVRKNELPDGLFEYGVSFTMEDQVVDYLSYLVNQLTVSFRRNPLPPHCGFCTQEDRRGCFTKHPKTIFHTYEARLDESS